VLHEDGASGERGAGARSVPGHLVVDYRQRQVARVVADGQEEGAHLQQREAEDEHHHSGNKRFLNPFGD